MGLLDDAIREHLELMRRRGADPTEIARAESEALSPPVREVEEPEHHGDADDLVAGTEPVPAPFDGEAVLEEDGEDSDAVESSGGEGLADGGQATEHFDVLGHSDAAEEAAIEDGDFEDSTLRAPDAAAEAEESEAEEFEEEDEDLFEEDNSFREDREPEASEDAGEIEGQQELPVGDDADGDVLEGTPDFLADSPDHDKLWFEQSGPRDFDFDGEDDK